MVLLQSHLLASEPREVVKVTVYTNYFLDICTLKVKEHKLLKSLSWVSNVFAVGKDHVRPKFSFHSHTHGETLSKISDMAEIFEPAVDQATEEDPIAECPNDFDERSEKREGVSVAESREVLHQYTERSVSKLLVPPPDKIGVIKRSFKPVSFLYLLD